MPGDYNHDGVVDAADYTIWRDTLGSTTDLRADGDITGASAGKIDQADYNFWIFYFGDQAGSGAGCAAGVPEPTSLLLLAMGVILLFPFDRCSLVSPPRSLRPGPFRRLVGALRRLGRINYGRPFVTRYFSYRAPGATRPSTSLIGKQYMKRGIVRLGVGMSVLLVATLGATANATNYMWTGASGLNVFETSANWSPNAGIPNAGDAATFALASNYEVSLTFPLPPPLGPSNITIGDLNLLTGNVTLSNSMVSGFIFPESLTVTDSLSLPNANGNTSLTLGAPGFPVSLSTNLTVRTKRGHTHSPTWQSASRP